MSEREEVLETIKMFQAIDKFLRSSNDYVNNHLYFSGYDGNCMTEYKLIKYVEDELLEGPYSDFLKSLNDPHNFHAISPQREIYQKMLKIWGDLDSRLQVDLDLLSVVELSKAAGAHFI